MSVNKLLTLTVAGVASLGVTTAALAGGPDYTPAPSYAGIYVEGNIGYAIRNWLQDPLTPIAILSSISSTSNGRGGFAGGVDIGYQFNQYFSVEGGWVYLPRAKSTVNNAGSVKINSGIAYGAIKLTAPIYENTYVFGKLGAGYVYNRLSGSLSSATSSSNYWNPLWAAGVQYYFNQNLSINLQYMNVAGYHRSSDSNFASPDTHLFTVGLGYKFLM